MTTRPQTTCCPHSGNRSWVVTVALSLAFMYAGCARPEADVVRSYALTPTARTMDIPYDAPRDPCLQAALVELDRLVADDLAIPPEVRAFGVLDFEGPRLAMINPDRMFYGASVPKIVIVFAYLLKSGDNIETLSPAVRHELHAVIKESNNKMAATYSRIVGLDYIQELLQSPAYRFYDKEHGGGLWCGKHYGIDSPRTGDPLEDRSHAATVRQCLRYFLLMEQNRLGGPQVSRCLREIFAAPWAEFHDDNFVAGLKHSGLNLIRKNGLWEDWHLDAARIELPDRPLLLAGMVRHPRGPAYLARMARMLTLLARDGGTPQDAYAAAMAPPERTWKTYRHRTIIHRGRNCFADGSMRNARLDDAGDCVLLECGPQAEACFESAPIETAIKFNELILSWNIDTPPAAGFCVEVQVGRRFHGSWSPWLYVGNWGEAVPKGDRVVRFDGGRIDVDYFTSDGRFDRFRYRVRSVAPAAEGTILRVKRIAACVSDLTGHPDSWTPVLHSPPRLDPQRWQRRLAVPFRSQFTRRPEIAGRICSPASLAMVLAFFGKEHATLDVADACQDPEHQIYGNWPRNIQAAFSLGVPGYVTRFSDWRDVEVSIAQGRPIIASIRFDRPGVISAAPYSTTDGHLIVICGFDAEGNVEVNDSAVGEPERGMLKYARIELEEAWFGGSGGVAYVLLPPPETQEASTSHMQSNGRP